LGVSESWAHGLTGLLTQMDMNGCFYGDVDY